jgi:hypothetical protein
MSELTPAQATPPIGKLRGPLRYLCEGANHGGLASYGQPNPAPESQ